MSTGEEDKRFSMSDSYRLLSLYRREETLWNMSARDYHNKEARNDALLRITRDMGPPFTADQVNTKLINMRSYYAKELHKVKQGLKLGKPHTSKWAFFVTMDTFLRSQVIPRKQGFNVICSTIKYGGKMRTKRCQWGTCRNDSRYYHKSHMLGVDFVPFPKPKSNLEKCKRWIMACGRPSERLNIDKVNRDKYVCTKKKGTSADHNKLIQTELSKWHRGRLFHFPENKMAIRLPKEKYIPTGRGGRYLCFEGYMYRVNKKKENNWTSWRCNSRGCSSTVSTVDEVVTMVSNTHTHPPVRNEKDDSEHFVGGRGPTPQHPDPVPFNPLIATNTGRFQSNISGISIKGEPGGTSNVVSPEVDIHETKPQISQLHDSVPTSSSQVRPSGVRNTPTAQFRPSFAQQRVARAQQVRHGNIQMGGRGGMASRPQPHSSHPRMSAPSSTVTSSAPPLKRPRLDPPRQVLQMSGNQQIRQAPVQRQNIGGFNQTQARMPVSRNAIGSSNRQQPPGPIGRPMQPRLLSGSPQRQGLRPSLQQLNVNANRQSKSDSSERAFLNPDHSSHIMTELSALWKSGKFVDAAVLVGGMKLQAHRMVLFAASPYLRASFDSMNPAAELRLKMPSDIKLDIVFQFLTYIYDGVLKLNPSNVISLLKISLMLQMEHLTACCREYIAQAVKMGTMQRFQEQNVETPLLVLVDHKAPETGQMKADMCTQTVTDSGRVQSIPRVDFERVFGEDRQSDQAGTQFDQGYQDIQSDVDLYRNYGTDGFKPDEDEGEGVHGEQVMHTSNEDDEGDDDDATPMMIIKNEFIDPEYELSLNAHHGTSPAADCDNASTSSNQTESRFEPETTVRNSDDPPDPGESTVSEPMQVVPGVDLDTSSQSSSDLPDHTLDQSTQEGGTHSPMNSSAIDSTQPSENSSSVLHSEIDTAPSIDTSLTTSSETDFTRNQSDQVNRTSSVSKGESSGVADNSLTITPSGPEQSESLDESGDQATPQFGTEEFLSSDFDLHPTKTEPKDPM